MGRASVVGETGIICVIALMDLRGLSVNIASSVDTAGYTDWHSFGEITYNACIIYFTRFETLNFQW